MVHLSRRIDFAAGETNTAMSSTMGANLGDRITGVFWAAFLLFSWTAASIVSERLKESIRCILDPAVVIGSVAWVVDLPGVGTPQDGWWNFGDIMMLMLQVLSLRLRADLPWGCLWYWGQAWKIFSGRKTQGYLPHNPWLVCVGLFIIYTGFWGFYVACNVLRWPRGNRVNQRRNLDGNHNLSDSDNLGSDHL